MAMAPSCRYTHYEQGNVLIQTLSEWNGERRALETAIEDWQRQAVKPYITGTVIDLDSECEPAQRSLLCIYSESATGTEIKKIALVSSGAEIAVDELASEFSQQIQTFESLSRAVGWAWE